MSNTTPADIADNTEIMPRERFGFLRQCLVMDGYRKVRNKPIWRHTATGALIELILVGQNSFCGQAYDEYAAVPVAGV